MLSQYWLLSKTLFFAWIISSKQSQKRSGKAVLDGFSTIPTPVLTGSGFKGSLSHLSRCRHPLVKRRQYNAACCFNKCSLNERQCVTVKVF